MPQVCYHPQLGPIQTCDTCLVEVNGQLVRACGTTVSEGMQIVTKSMKSESARREAFDLILGNDLLYCSRRCRKMVETRSCAIRRRTSKDGARAGRSPLIERAAAPKAQECYGRSSKKEASRHAAPDRAGARPYLRHFAITPSSRRRRLD